MKFLIVGLGNPGVNYDDTRHNIGFKALDHVSKQANALFVSGKYGDKTSFKYKGRSIFLLKPNTYMNLSGLAVKYWMKKEKISSSNLLIVTDDLNLLTGILRLKTNGTDGGHNGLKNIQEVLGTTKYPRLRVGIGNTFSKGKQVDYVLGSWTEEEKFIINEKLKTINDMILSYCFNGINNTMNFFNSK